MASSWAPPVRADIESVPCLALPSLSSVRGPSHPPQRHQAVLASRPLLMPFPLPGRPFLHHPSDVQSWLNSAAPRAQYCHVFGVTCAPGGQGPGPSWSLLCSQCHPAQRKQLSVDCAQRLPERVPLTLHPLWVSPLTDQSPGKDSEAWVPDSEERLILREEFTSRMHQRFLDGKDGDFDYRCSHAPPRPPPAQHTLDLSCMPGTSREGLPS